MSDKNKPYYQEVYDWAFSNMEGCDEPEYSMYLTICYAIDRYKREKFIANCLEDYDQHLRGENR